MEPGLKHPALVQTLSFCAFSHCRQGRAGNGQYAWCPSCVLSKAERAVCATVWEMAGPVSEGGEGEGHWRAPLLRGGRGRRHVAVEQVPLPLADVHQHVRRGDVARRVDRGISRRLRFLSTHLRGSRWVCVAASDVACRCTKLQ